MGIDEGRQQQVDRVCAKLRVGPEGQVIVVHPRTGLQREWPVLGDRLGLLRRLHRQLAYCSGDRLFEAVRREYVWNGMREDCRYVARTALPN